MTRYRTTALAAVAAGLALVASVAVAHSGGMGGGMEGGMEGRHGGMGGGMHGNMQGHMGGHQGGGMGAGQQLMTPQEREALREKMRNAATPEERQALAAATRAEMEKRAKEKGITLPERRPGAGGGQGQGGGHRH